MLPPLNTTVYQLHRHTAPGYEPQVWTSFRLDGGAYAPSTTKYTTCCCVASRRSTLDRSCADGRRCICDAGARITKSLSLGEVRIAGCGCDGWLQLRQAGSSRDHCDRLALVARRKGCLLPALARDQQKGCTRKAGPPLRQAGAGRATARLPAAGTGARPAKVRKLRPRSATQICDPNLSSATQICDPNLRPKSEILRLSSCDSSLAGCWPCSSVISIRSQTLRSSSICEAGRKLTYQVSPQLLDVGLAIM